MSEKIKYKRHFPGFCDVSDEDRKEMEFGNLEDLLKYGPVISWSDLPNVIYCISIHKEFKNYANLMVDYIKDNKRTWWVLGYIEYNDIQKIKLPHWDFEGKFRNITKEIL